MPNFDKFERKSLRFLEKSNREKAMEYCEATGDIMPSWNDEDAFLDFLLRFWLWLSPSSAFDSGRYGKAAELAIRSKFARRHIFTVKSSNASDLVCAQYGRVEIKTCFGTLCDTKGMDYIFYAPCYDATEFLAPQFFIFSEKEWEDFINGYNGRGQFIVKSTAEENCYRIQSFYIEGRTEKASKPIRRYIDEVTSTLTTLDDVWYGNN